MSRLQGYEVHEVCAEFWPREYDGVVAATQCYGALVEVDADVVVAGSLGLEEDEADVCSHRDKVEVAPVMGDSVEVVGQIVRTGDMKERQKRHQCLGMAEAKHGARGGLGIPDVIVGCFDYIQQEFCGDVGWD